MDGLKGEFEQRGALRSYHRLQPVLPPNWTGRAGISLGLLAILVTLSFLVGGGTGNSTVKRVPLFGLLSIAWLSVLGSLYQPLAGLVAALAGAGLVIFVAIAAERHHLLAVTIFGFPFVVAGILVLIGAASARYRV